MLHIALLIACALAIYVACEWFVNAIEWLGARLSVGHMAVGAILAAAGTALPETVVTLMAVLVGSPQHGDDIAVGAAMGGPLVVGTIAYAVTGAMLLVRHRNKAAVLRGAGGVRPSRDLRANDGIDTGRLAHDQRWFLSIFVFKVALGLIAFSIKPWLGLAFLAAYGVYVYREMSGDSSAATADGLARLKLRPRSTNPGLMAIVVQTFGSLVVIFGASQMFVKQLEWAGPALGLPAMVVALLLSPVATELPEILNAIIWVRHGKTDLALANISGAMMIQATVPSAIGIGFTPWKFDTPLVLAGLATIASIAYLLWAMKHHTFSAAKLLGAGGFYVLFAVGLTVTI
jgi:cation:H+ antiporter